MGETSMILALTLIATVLAVACILWQRSILGSETTARIFYVITAVMSFAAWLWIVLSSIGMLPRILESTTLLLVLIYRGWIVIGTALGSVLLMLVDQGAGPSFRKRDVIRSFISSPFLLRGLCLSVSISFICTEIGKLSHDADMRQFFLQSGYPLWFLYFVITAESVGALGLLFPRTRMAAAFGLALIMVGAISTHLHNRDPFSDALEALHLLLLLTCIVLIRFSAKRTLPQGSGENDTVRTAEIQSTHAIP